MCWIKECFGSGSCKMSPRTKSHVGTGSKLARAWGWRESSATQLLHGECSGDHGPHGARVIGREPRAELGQGLTEITPHWRSWQPGSSPGPEIKTDNREIGTEVKVSKTEFAFLRCRLLQHPASGPFEKIKAKAKAPTPYLVGVLTFGCHGFLI